MYQGGQSTGTFFVDIFKMCKRVFVMLTETLPCHMFNILYTLLLVNKVTHDVNTYQNMSFLNCLWTLGAKQLVGWIVLNIFGLSLKTFQLVCQTPDCKQEDLDLSRVHLCSLSSLQYLHPKTKTLIFKLRRGELRSRVLLSTFSSSPLHIFKLSPPLEVFLSMFFSSLI